MIEFKGVSKIYNNNVKALSNVNVKIDTGEFVFLVGPSGAGKSTFIKMLLKEVEPTTGTVTVGDTESLEFPVTAIDTLTLLNLTFPPR